MGEAEPTPDDLWLFDGVCNLCSGSVALVLKLDRRGVVCFTPIQSPYGRRLAIQAGLDPDQPQSFLFFDRGVALRKSAAVLALLIRVPPPLNWLRFLRLVPEAWRDGAYDWIAAHRYRLFGMRRACMVPTPEIRARFILEAPTA